MEILFQHPGFPLLGLDAFRLGTMHGRLSGFFENPTNVHFLAMLKLALGGFF
jgi:hypothetical protein